MVPDAPVSENSNHPPALTLPFIAPPSSPASFLNSEPPSSAQSPGGFLSLSTLAANAYSPTGPSSIFAIGPYANETQLVSPPVFSNFTTEPNTAPFTPPPESVQLTTPSSPEVPFAQLLSSSFDSNCKKGEAYEFQSYQLYPGSPIGHLISPSSVCSGTSSPFPDLEFHSSGGPPKILTAECLAERKLIPRCSSQKHGSILDGQIPAILPANDESAVNHRVSFELTAEEVARCMEKKPAMPGEAALESSFRQMEFNAKRDQLMDEARNSEATYVGETSHDVPERIESSGELVASKEFKFSNSDGAAVEPSVGSEWWVNEKVTSAEAVPPKDWAFFPMVQPGVS